MEEYLAFMQDELPEAYLTERDPLLSEHTKRDNSIHMYHAEDTLKQTTPQDIVTVPAHSLLQRMEPLRITISKFSGISSENPEKFLQDFSTYCILNCLHNDADDTRKCAAFHLHLTGPALVWYNTLDQIIQQGSHRALKTLKVLDFRVLKFKYLNPLIFVGLSLKYLKSTWIMKTSPNST